ncbi:MFS transporter [Pseudobacter ginsenosidimutans]|jgi:ACS family hexuronate transporter-like MFS transporter|uniref:ACS family hexuronate transporter-like MFS transporter n=1 Tax=Pseudobacter ginsenosidimutans TaxID=661488 RepID=A0A4Q7M8I4_9BACT|nr:MFS transporter [Pseudobacter ginsenosidimutans]QEC42598.1 MFS transporter [Pseudobacter ginsenosidimutans]RZS63911.1 ACS family hexuronate transporter-like MFS transporter [Pseudobacter ginsenosidimutans]
MQPTGKYRWKIVALLFFATTINYIDRQILGVLAPLLQENMNWSESAYGWIVAGFQAAYAIGLLVSGALLDRFGVKWGYTIAVAIWSLACMLHAAAGTLFLFVIMRFLLGLGESANFPAAVKTVATWFPKKERALATGIFNSGSNIAAIITPLAIPWIALQAGWQWAFIISGMLGILWLICWRKWYHAPQDHPKISEAERDWIEQDGPEPMDKLPWKQLVLRRQTLGFAVSLFLTAPVWWFFLYWLPKFLHSEHQLSITGMAWPLVIVYLISDAGALAGGWFSSRMVSKGAIPVTARIYTILLLSLLVIPVMIVPFIQQLGWVIALIALATFAHQGYASNIFTLVSDIFPKNATGAVTGIAMFSGAIGGMIFSSITGLVLERTGDYTPIFIFCGCAYLLSWAILAVMVRPRYRRHLQIADQN